MLPAEVEHAIECRQNLLHRRQHARLQPLIRPAVHDNPFSLSLLVIRSHCPADGHGVSNDTVDGLVEAVRQRLENPARLQVVEKFVSSSEDVRQLSMASASVRRELQAPTTAAIYCLYGSHWPEAVCDEMAGLYEVIVSKQWMCHSLLSVPPVTVVDASFAARRGVKHAAAKALQALCALTGEPIQHGVVKLGYSWEGMGVWRFDDIDSLTGSVDAALGCTVGTVQDCCFVQTWVDARLEMRLFVVEGTVRHVAYNVANTLHVDGHNVVQSMNETKAAQMCGGEAPLAEALSLATAVVSSCLAWAATIDSSCVVVPFIRFDFLISTNEKSVPTVHLIEVTEPGAMLFDWVGGATVVHNAIARAIVATINDSD